MARKTKEERKARRRRILSGVGRVLGGAVGVGADLIPGSGAAGKLIKAAGAAITTVEPKGPIIAGALEGHDWLDDIIPLIRTIKALKRQLEHFLDKIWFEREWRKKKGGK